MCHSSQHNFMYDCIMQAVDKAKEMVGGVADTNAESFLVDSLPVQGQSKV